MKKSEVKPCTGNGLLDIWELVIVYSGGITLSPIKRKGLVKKFLVSKRLSRRKELNRP